MKVEHTVQLWAMPVIGLDEQGMTPYIVLIALWYLKVWEVRSSLKAVLFFRMLILNTDSLCFSVL